MMRSTTFFLAVIILLVTAQACCADEASEVKSILFKRLRLVADSGKLDEPESVARMLDLKFEILTQQKTSTTADCLDNLGMRSFVEKKAVLTGANWYHSLPTGVQNIEVRFFEHSRTMGPPSFSYTVEHRIGCFDRDAHGLHENTVARMNFTDLPGFACITADDVKTYMPDAEFIMGTDMHHQYAYRGERGHAAGTTLKFFYYSNIPCALDAKIEQERPSKVGKGL